MSTGRRTNSSPASTLIRVRQEIQARDGLMRCCCNQRQCGAEHRLSACAQAATVADGLGLTMGVATLITVMTIVQGANLYVEQKIANLGTERLPDRPHAVCRHRFQRRHQSPKNKHIEIEDLRAVQEKCVDCKAVGASGNTTARFGTATTNWPTSTSTGTRRTWPTSTPARVSQGRYFTDSEKTSDPRTSA